MTPAQQLNYNTRDLHQKWEVTKVLWKDSVSRNFESKFVIPFFDQLRHTQSELDKLGQVIVQAQRNVK